MPSPTAPSATGPCQQRWNTSRRNAGAAATSQRDGGRGLVDANAGTPRWTRCATKRPGRNLSRSSARRTAGSRLVKPGSALRPPSQLRTGSPKHAVVVRSQQRSPSSAGRRGYEHGTPPGGPHEPAVGAQAPYSSISATVSHPPAWNQAHIRTSVASAASVARSECAIDIGAERWQASARTGANVSLVPTLRMWTPSPISTTYGAPAHRQPVRAGPGRCPVLGNSTTAR